MSEINKIMISGRIGNEIKVRDLDGGKKYAVFSLAMNRRVRGSTGEWSDKVTWFNFTTYSQIIINRIEERNICTGYRVLITGQIRKNIRMDPGVGKNVTYWNFIANNVDD